MIIVLLLILSLGSAWTTAQYPVAASTAAPSDVITILTPTKARGPPAS
jgi:hypothetical protein